MKRGIAIIIALAVAVLLAQAALANQQGGGGKGKGQGGRGEGKRPGVVFGVLQSVSGSTWTIKPELPPHLRERAQEKGRELPQLPDKVTVTVNDSTKFYFNGAAGKASSFKTGDEVVVKLDKPMMQGGSVAQAVADPETARTFIMEKLKERGQGGEGQTGPGGQGGERRPRLIFGTVSSVSNGSITVKPEIPEFIKDVLPNKGEKLGKFEDKLPASISVKVDDQTKFVVNKQEQFSNPFKNGDKVAILPQGEPGNATARIVSDYASAKARMQERMEQRQQKRGHEGQGKGKGKNKNKG